MPCFLKSSLTKKYIMAVTGLMLIGFVVLHLIGNLQIFIGREAMNHYAETLKNLGAFLWVARLGLLTIFVAHIVTAIQLTKANRQARPTPYFKEDTLKATLTSRTMMLSGLLILAYVVFHLMHFTLHKTHPEFATLVDAKGRHDVYQMVILGFSNLPVTLTYIIAMLILGAHLHHGASSVFQSLGLNTPKYQKCTRVVGPGLAAAITLGYLSIPLAVFFGWIK